MYEDQFHQSKESYSVCLCQIQPIRYKHAENCIKSTMLTYSDIVSFNILSIHTLLRVNSMDQIIVKYKAVSGITTHFLNLNILVQYKRHIICNSTIRVRRLHYRAQTS